MSEGYSSISSNMLVHNTSIDSAIISVKSNYINTSDSSTVESVDFDTTSVSTESNFEKFNDRQKITFETSPIAKYILNKNQIDKYKDDVDENGLHHVKVGRNVKELTDEMLGLGDDVLDSSKGYWIDPKLVRTLQATDGADSVIVEEIIHNPDTGFDAVVLRDAQGNLRLYYSCTDDRQEKDLFHDVAVGLHGNTNLDAISDLIFQGKDDSEKINTESYTQRKQAEQAAEYCYQMIKKERAEGKDVQLSMSGYSLGGSNCEYGYLALSKNHSDVKDIVNGLNLLNPLHGGLTSEEANTVKQANNFTLYANEMDFIHTINNYDDFKDVQQLYFANAHWKDDESSKTLVGLAGNMSHQIGNLGYEDDYANEVFDENGNLRTTNSEGRGPHAYNSREMFKQYYGHSYTNYYQTAHQAISEFVPDTGCEFLSDGEYLISDWLISKLNEPFTLLTTDFSSPSSIVDSMATAGGNVINGPVSIATDGFALLCDIPGLLSYVPEGENFFFDGLHNVGKFFNNVGDGAQKVGKHITNFVDDAVHNAADFVKDTGTAVYENVLEPAGKAVYDNVIEPVGEFFSDPIGSICSWFS